MRSAKESGCFPYGSKNICYIEALPNGEVRQLTAKQEKLEAYLNAKSGASNLLAVWPGRWRSDLFAIDDLEAFCEGQMLFG